MKKARAHCRQRTEGMPMAEKLHQGIRVCQIVRRQSTTLWFSHPIHRVDFHSRSAAQSGDLPLSVLESDRRYVEHQIRELIALCEQVALPARCSDRH
jgi:hypothetical protein